jgi:hypothetical protein
MEKAERVDTHGADRAAAVLSRLHELGAINLDVLLERADEVRAAVGDFDDGEYGYCYPFYIHVGPPHYGDIVSVASQVKQLGFTISR